ncbi:uncharacterized protein FIESC28_04829 [Fusarium coffeatum]|uniref:Dol-P-Man:Man(5)GlcNAc(2)-PP-Dol alpha-1,3-mannosyltransferase n=1 Tax=Fusarium coffeatum TaxID=231269 RepID=A0A366RWX0_9HYPO|nr:uncharacterized protein FIESC28_04829 [Fusarium coffeatum]RBR21561.1 hypothetical protein FIESC28_04829 [Fusarium coffeatum]
MAEPAPGVVAQSTRFVKELLTGQHALSKLIPVALWLADAVGTSLIIWKVPYTEIDWVAYMQQVSQFISGERDYTKIKGDTGPLVYPAAHVYTFTGLYHITDEGKDIFLAQQIFGVLQVTRELITIWFTNVAQVPPYMFIFLIASKRLHSLFVLRCFNDCFAVFFLWLSIFFFQRRNWTFGCLAYTWGLGTKMSLLLVLPAVGVLLLLGRGFWPGLRLAWIMAQVQFVIGLPFIMNNGRGYAARAFELSREFKFEWTVNWRMLGEEVFPSKKFALFLLACHVTALLVFISQRWLQPTGRPLSALVPSFLRLKSPFTVQEQLRISNYVTPEFVMTTMLSANVIGLLFARSLHYQFYAYLAWASPYLLWRATEDPFIVLLIWAAQEWAWNIFPSTDLSSRVVVGAMFATVVLVYRGTAWSAVPPSQARNIEAKDK